MNIGFQLFQLHMVSFTCLAKHTQSQSGVQGAKRLERAKSRSMIRSDCICQCSLAFRCAQGVVKSKIQTAGGGILLMSTSSYFEDNASLEHLKLGCCCCFHSMLEIWGSWFKQTFRRSVSAHKAPRALLLHTTDQMHIYESYCSLFTYIFPKETKSTNSN